MTTHGTNDSDFEVELAHQLATATVPPVPKELDTVVHERLNRTLHIHHCITFLTMVIPATITAMLTPIGHLVFHTISGRPRRSPGAKEDS